VPKDQTFRKWLETAGVGDTIIYYRGWLSKDRKANRAMTDDQKRVANEANRLAKAVQLADDTGQIDTNHECVSGAGERPAFIYTACRRFQTGMAPRMPALGIGITKDMLMAGRA
jgi:hypothetical protein